MEEARLTKVFSPVPAGGPRARWVVVPQAQWAALPVRVPLRRWVVALPEAVPLARWVAAAPRARWGVLLGVVVPQVRWVALPAPRVRPGAVAMQDREP